MLNKAVLFLQRWGFYVQKMLNKAVHFSQSWGVYVQKMLNKAVLFLQLWGFYVQKMLNKAVHFVFVPTERNSVHNSMVVQSHVTVGGMKCDSLNE